MNRRRLLLGLAVLPLALGLWQIGEAAYIHAKARLAQHLIATAWAETVGGSRAVKPWPWADAWPVARLEFPAAGEDMIVLSGGSGRTLAFAPGHLDGSPLPGAPGNSIIGGHRDTHFRLLERLAPGDVIHAEDRTGVRYRFRVTAKRVVDSRTTRLDPDGVRPALILVTCYPFDAIVPGGPLRYLVFAEADPGPRRSGTGPLPASSDPHRTDPNPPSEGPSPPTEQSGRPLPDPRPTPPPARAQPISIAAPPSVGVGG